MSSGSPKQDRGPFVADQIHEGDPYELSNGHPIYCPPAGGRGSRANALGFSVVSSDPAVKEAGIDTGYSPEPGMLRAPDVAVGNVPDAPGWVHGVPSLAIEYADVGQDEPQLTAKIADLLGAGTKYLWVVRLAGPRRVEIHRPGLPVETALPGAHLTAPGVLENPVLVEALYDRGAAERATLTNLLQRQGYADLDGVLAQGQKQALAQAVLDLYEARFGAVPADHRARVQATRDVGVLRRWLLVVGTGSADDAARALASATS